MTPIQQLLGAGDALGALTDDHTFERHDNFCSKERM